MKCVKIVSSDMLQHPSSIWEQQPCSSAHCWQCYNLNSYPSHQKSQNLSHHCVFIQETCGVATNDCDLSHWYCTNSLHICITATAHERKEDMSSAESSDFTGSEYPSMELCNYHRMINTHYIMWIVWVFEMSARKVHSLISHHSSVSLCCAVSYQSSPGKIKLWGHSAWSVVHYETQCLQICTLMWSSCRQRDTLQIKMISDCPVHKAFSPLLDHIGLHALRSCELFVTMVYFSFTEIHICLVLILIIISAKTNRN